MGGNGDSSYQPLSADRGRVSVETVVDYLIGEGFPADRINVGYAGYTRNGRNVEIESFFRRKAPWQTRRGYHYRLV